MNESLPLLQRIPKEQLSSQQKALRKKSSPPLHTLFREPSSLTEFDSKTQLAIWRDNGTILVWNCDDENEELFRGRYLHFSFEGMIDVDCTIYGETDDAIAETFTYFVSLHQPADTAKAVLLCYCPSDSPLDLHNLQPAQLAHILDSNPARRIEISATINAEQAHVLATRPYPLDLKLVGQFVFLDRGTAFLDALEHRTTPRRNFERLLKLDHVVEEHEISAPNQASTLLPFSAKVNILHYRVLGWFLQPEDFTSLKIVAKNLSVKFFLDSNDDWTAVLVAFLNRVAELGHFERLSLSILFRGGMDYETDAYVNGVAPVVEALISAIHANPKLSCLNFSDDESHLHWGPFFQWIFEEIKDHPSLRTIVVQSYEPKNDSDEDEDESQDEDEEFERTHLFDPSWLIKLHSHNRNIVVVDMLGNKCTNGSTIDKAYALNEFYNGSLALVNESASLRTLLVATALTRSASINFQFTALLLSQYADTMCELCMV